MKCPEKYVKDIKKREKLKVFEFWAFQKQVHMPSREKYIFHMLFRAFNNNPPYTKN